MLLNKRKAGEIIILLFYRLTKIKWIKFEATNHLGSSIEIPANALTTEDTMLNHKERKVMITGRSVFYTL